MRSVFCRCGDRGRVALGGVAMLTAMLATGCGAGPAGVSAPSWDPDGLAADVLNRCDANGDGQLDANELTQAPGLASSMKFVDTSGDGKLSSEELQARFTLYAEVKVGLKGKEFRVTHNGRPVANAEVAFTPEPFLEGLVEPAKGTTDARGSVYPEAGVNGLPGMRIGFYRVSVAGGSAPAKYSGPESPLGIEVSPVVDDPSNYGSRELTLTD